MMTCSTATGCACFRSLLKSCSCRLSGAGFTSFDLLPLEEQGRPLGFGGVAATGAAAAADAERARSSSGAAGACLLACAPRFRAEADQRRAATGEVGRSADLGERDLAGAAPARPQHAPASLEPDRRLCRRL